MADDVVILIPEGEWDYVGWSREWTGCEGAGRWGLGDWHPDDPFTETFTVEVSSSGWFIALFVSTNIDNLWTSHHGVYAEEDYEITKMVIRQYWEAFKERVKKARTHFEDISDAQQ